MSEGTFDNARDHYLLSARRGYLDLVLGLMDQEHAPSTHNYDVLGKVEYRINPAHCLAFHLLHAGDRLDFIEDDEDEDNTTYDNSYAWLTLKSMVTPRLFARTLVSIGGIGHHRHGIGYEGDNATVEFIIRDKRQTSFAGLKHTFNNHINFRVEAYSKILSDLRPRYSNLSNEIEIFPELQDDRYCVHLRGGTPEALKPT